MVLTHLFHLKAFMLPYIADNSKGLEIRVADSKRKVIKVGHIIEFFNAGNTSLRYRRRVLAIRSYDTFEAMLVAEDCDNIMPGWSKEKILSGLKRIYNTEKEKLGVLVFELAPCE